MSLEMSSTNFISEGGDSGSDTSIFQRQEQHKQWQRKRGKQK